MPGSFVSFLADALRPPVFLAALAGLALAAWRRAGRCDPRAARAARRRDAARSSSPASPGLSILPRYLTVPAIALTLYAGYAIAGWVDAARERPAAPPVGDRRRACSRCSARGSSSRGSRSVERFTAELRFIRGTHDDLVAILAEPAVRRGPRVRPGDAARTTGSSRTRAGSSTPRSAQVGARSARRRPYGVALFFTDAKMLRRFGFAQGASTLTNVPDPGYVLVAHNGRYAAYVRCR